jgi:hypothetical protein
LAEKPKPKLESVVLKRKVGYIDNNDSEDDERAVCIL